jgi:pimeloyl-ACP methyl ester carboxylesterase
MRITLDGPRLRVIDSFSMMKTAHRHTRRRIGLLPAVPCLVWMCGFAAAAFSAPASIPSIAGPIQIDQWHILGPFSAGPREDAFAITSEPATLRPDTLARHPSTLAQGGYVRWTTARPDSDGWVNVKFSGVLWDTLMDVYGFAGIMDQAYAYGEFDLPSPRRALVEAERVGFFWLNGRLVPGDPYGHNFMRSAVVLSGGTNRIVVDLSGFGDHAFKLLLHRVPSPLVLIDDYTLPDVVRGERGPVRAGVPLLNTTETPLEGIRITAGDGRYTLPTVTWAGDLAPLCVKKIPITIEVVALPDSGESLEVPIEAGVPGSVCRDTLRLRLRRPDESVRRTFISRIDGSCQYYAVLPPAGLAAGERYGMILSLHGAGVRAENQVGAYRPKSWAFVVAPTNRRPYGFDWQDWGRLDALEVLDRAKNTLPVDTNRVYLTGHSMGGHGAWHIGLSHSDLFAALAPAAGWTCFELYIPWFLQKAYIYGDPAAREIREAALRQDHPQDFIENALNLPVFILQGGLDDNVPPFHSRLLAGRLDALGYEYRYKEDPGKGHWYTIDSLGTTCVDDPDLIGFLQSKTRNPYPRDVVLKTVNPSQAGRSYWLRLDEQEEPYRESVLEAHVRPDTVEIALKNVKTFSINLSEDLLPEGVATVIVDGASYRLGFAGRETFVFSQRGGKMRPGENREAGPVKTAARYGPIKQAMFSPFVLVYGTQGGPDLTDLLLDLARLEAVQWWRRANGFVEVVPDTQVTREDAETHNLILFGGPNENSVSKRIAPRMPIAPAAGGVRLGGEVIPGPGLALRVVYPNPLAPDRLVVMNAGSDRAGLALLASMRTVYAGAGLPDFMIYDAGVRRLGWGGVVAAGFFDSDWGIDHGLLYRRPGQEGGRP